jgi:hypothetical protein
MLAANEVSTVIRAVLLGFFLVAVVLAAVWAREWRSWARLALLGALAAIAGASSGGLHGGLGSVLFGAVTACLAGTLTMLQIGPGPPWYEGLRRTAVAIRVSLGAASVASILAFATWAFAWGDPGVPIVLVLIAATAAAVHLLLVLKARFQIDNPPLQR